MKIFDFIILALATWRISSLFIYEDGPWYTFWRVRQWNEYFEDNAEEHKIEVKYKLKVLTCILCFSVWASAFIYIAWLFAPQITMWIATPLAISAAAILIDNHLGGG